MATYEIFHNAAKPIEVTPRRVTEGCYIKIQDTIVHIAYKVIKANEDTKTYTVCTPELRKE